jgi:hypothetical protein
VKVASGQLAAHLPALMSEQLVPFRHCAQVLSGPPQLASHEKPDEFRLHDTSLSQASLQLVLDPQPASATPSAARHPVHRLFTCLSPFIDTGGSRDTGHRPVLFSRPGHADGLHPHLAPPAAARRRHEAESTH